jgi:hypothetical protein
LTPGIPDEHLERIHWNYGGGKGALGFRHIPSGITVARECPRGVPIVDIDRELQAELKEKLLRAGIIRGEAQTGGEPARKDSPPND